MSKKKKKIMLYLFPLQKSFLQKQLSSKKMPKLEEILIFLLYKNFKGENVWRDLI
jgi:hypothetical protein